MKQNIHRIRRHKWAVQANSEEDAFRLRKYFLEHGQEILLPVLEKVFDETAADDVVVHIPRIELKVNMHSERQLTEDLPDLLSKQLREQMQYVVNNYKKDIQEDSITKSLICKETPELADRFEILLHYLQTGLIPWHASSNSESETTALLRETCREEWRQIMGYLLTIQESESVYFRLLQLMPETELKSLISGIADAHSRKLGEDLMQCIHLLFISDEIISSKYIKLKTAAMLFSESFRWKGNGPVPDLFQLAMDYLPEEKMRQAFYSLIEVANGKGKTPPPLFKGGLGGVFSDTPISNRIPTIENERDKNVPPIVNLNVDRRGFLTPPGGYSDVHNSYNCDLQDLSKYVIDGLFPLKVQHAGLVLLHPFITRYFESTGIIEKCNEPLISLGSTKGDENERDKNVSPIVNIKLDRRGFLTPPGAFSDNQLSPLILPRAAALLHLLATGTEEIIEHKLGIIKILLGLHPETPLPVSEGLINTDDREEAEAMLKSAIDHWSILKNTSINGLRSSFLQRPAIVREEEIGWLLQIERKPYDILLEHLPWSISIIKLPWMKKAIYTEW